MNWDFTFNPARSKIGPIVKSFMHGPYGSWREWPVENQENCWKKFLEFFRFSSPEQEEMGHKVFNAYIRDNYRRWMNKAREGAMKNANSQDLRQARQHPPKWMSSQNWEILIERWLSEDWLKKSEYGKANRSNNTLNHTGGSRPFVHHEEELEKEKGRKPTELEKWEKTHQDKDGAWVSERAEKIHDDYSAKIGHCSSSSVESTPIVDNIHFWCDVTGGSKKGRVTGYGSREDARAILGSQGCSSYHSGSGQPSESQEVVLQRLVNDAVQQAIGPAVKQAVGPAVQQAVGPAVQQAITSTLGSNSDTMPPARPETGGSTMPTPTVRDDGSLSDHDFDIENWHGVTD